MFVLGFVVIGTIIVLTSRAAGPFASLDAGAGTALTGAATLVSDGTAFGSSAVRFGAVPTTPPSSGNNGLLTGDPNFFPIAVWLQTPESNGPACKAIGVNTFFGLYDGATSSTLGALINNSLYTVATQNNFALSNSLGSAVKGWAQDDEPDNAQSTGSGYGPCVSPSTIVSNYNTWKAADSQKRPVVINFGAGAAYTNWEGRGSCSGNTAMYSQYAAGADILSFDIYPNAGRYGPAYSNAPAPMTLVATGVDNLRSWGGGKPVWAIIETTDYNGLNTKPTPAQVKAEVWMALTHGATGIGYFAHILSPTFKEAGLLTDSTMSAAVGAINSQIQSLAPVLNSANVTNGTTVSASTRVDTMVKKIGNTTYLFAVNTASGSTTATFNPTGISSGTVTVNGEGRTFNLSGGTFNDSFSGYGVHIYQIN